METRISVYRHPAPNEQEVLEGIKVRLVESGEQERFDALLVEHHYLHSAAAVGEQMRYVATYEGKWLGLALWAAPALHLRAREEFIGWDDEQRRQRLGLITNNTRLLILPECHYPNLISRFMKLMLGRLSADWQERWAHPVALVETFVDPQLFQGTAYKVSGWTKLGATAGFARTGLGQDYYVAHGRPKQLWVRELCQGAAQKLRACALPVSWAAVETATVPRCRAKAPEIRSLVGYLNDLPEFRRKQSMGYPLAGMLALMAMATLCGVVRGQRDLAAFARTLSQGQLRALKFRCNNRTRRVRCPEETTFFRVLKGVDEDLLESALLAWQQQLLGPVRDTVIAMDGKKLRHAQGVELVSAIGVQSGRWLGSVRSAKKSNEIPAARALLKKLDLVGKTIVADALHTQVETAQQIVFDGGADYVFTVKDNQKTLRKSIAKLLKKQPFSPSTHSADQNLPAGAEPRPPGNPRARKPGDDAPSRLLSCGRTSRQTEAPRPAQGQTEHRDSVFDQQPPSENTLSGRAANLETPILEHRKHVPLPA